MLNKVSKDQKRKTGFVLIGVGFVLWLIFRGSLLGDISFLMLVAGVIIFLINPEKRHEKADAGVRLGSWIIDVTIVHVVVWTLTFLSGASESFGNFLSLAISPGYFTYFFGNGQTLGMKAAKIKLCGTDGTYPIGYGKGFIRWIGMIISGLVIGLGFLWILIDENKQGWHDKIAGTYVLNEGMTMEVPEEREKEKEEEPIKSPTEEATAEINETEVDLSGKFSWREASVREGIVTFECPECKKTHSFKTTLFSSQSPNPAVGLIPTSQEILWGKEIRGMVLAFVVAVTFGVFVAVLVGYGIWIALVCAVIYMILKPVFTPKFMNKLPVWIFNCNSCGKRTFIASDGTEAAIGELQANAGE